MLNTLSFDSCVSLHYMPGVKDIYFADSNVVVEVGTEESAQRERLRRDGGAEYE